MRQLFIPAILSVLMTVSVSSKCHAEFINYAVGNSLTADLLNSGAFDSLTVGQADPSTTYYQINCNGSLTNTWANPTASCVQSSYTRLYESELSAHLDNVFLQPFYGATLQQEVDSIKQFIDYAKQNPANANTNFYVYATWFEKDSQGTSYVETWNNHQATFDGLFIPSESSYDLLMSTLKSEGYDVSMIPAGHSFVAIAEAMRSGLVIDGLTNEGDLYRDNLHASNAGRYVAALTAYATLYDKDPTGLSMGFPFNLEGYGPQLTGNGIVEVQQIVWNTHLAITAVPEPTSMAALSCAAVVFGLRRFRRKIAA